MPDQVPSFEQSSRLEGDIKKLGAEIKNQRENPETKNFDDREMLKEAMKRSFPTLEKKPQGVPAASAPAPTDASSPLPDYAQAATPATKLEIESLLGVAFSQGLEKAFSQARKSPYFVQDAFHDALAGKLYPELQKRGIVK